MGSPVETLLNVLRRMWLGRGLSVSFSKDIIWTGYTKPMKYSPQSFLQTIRPSAMNIQTETGIPWVFTASQAAHESRYGNSRLTTEANNLFGITGDSWAQKGRPVYWIETLEYSSDKVPFKIRRPFRKYLSWEESLRDWASLIKRRYPAALIAAQKGDFKGFAEGLQTGGYATDPKYATKLVALHRSIALSADDTPLESQN